MELISKCVLTLACLCIIGTISYVGFVIGFHNGMVSHPFPVVIPHDRITGTRGEKIGLDAAFSALTT